MVETPYSPMRLQPGSRGSVGRLPRAGCSTRSSRPRGPRESTARAGLDDFLREPSPRQALLRWLALGGRAAARPLEGRRSCGCSAATSPAWTTCSAARSTPSCTTRASRQLEASWRGLRYLVEQAEGAENVKIRVLSVAWNELARDLERAIEFDQSQLFRKVYSDEFGTPGGEPFGLLLGDYEIRPRPSAEHPIDDVATLAAISQVAAAAFAPFVAGVHPAMFGLDQFTELEQPLNLAKTFDQLEYLKWKALRADARTPASWA